MAGKKRRAAIKELKKKRRDRAVDKDGRPLSKKRARQEEDEPDEPDEPDELVGLQSAEGAFYLVDAAAERVYDSARDVYDRLVAAGRWDASARSSARAVDDLGGVLDASPSCNRARSIARTMPATEMASRRGYEVISPVNGAGAASSATPLAVGDPEKSRLPKKVLYGCAGAVAVFLGLVAVSASGAEEKLLKHKLPPTPAGASDDRRRRRFILPDFDTRKPFASASPLAENKDKPLMEFTPANKAYLTTSTEGFRTMLKVSRDGGEPKLAQPFFSVDDDAADRTMLIGMNELEIAEVDAATGLETRILYYTVPGEDFPALVRRVTITNLEDTEAAVDVVDGLARLEPFGVNSGQLAAMGRTLEGWMRVYNCGRDEDSDVVDKGPCELPYFKLSASTADSAQVAMITEGNFAFGFVEDGDESTLVPMIVDPDVVFGSDTTFREPLGFTDYETLAAADEVKVSKTPCAFALAQKTLAPGAAMTLVEVFGHAKTVEQLTGDIAPKARDRVRRGQMQLDNLLAAATRVPRRPENPKVYHTFSRIHGDLERDYNNYQIDTTYYSQGSGNYRDVNQNRRVGADGYNPLTVATAFFSMGGGGGGDDDGADDAADAAASVAADVCADDKSAKKLASILGRPFRPGDLFVAAKAAKVELSVEREAFLDAVAAASDQVFAANYTHEGFWADHWDYDLDQVISFEAIFPDDVERAMWDGEPLPFYMSSGTVQPRDFKYVEVPELGVRQYNSVYDDPAKLGQLNDRITKPDGAFELARDSSGETDDAHTYVYAVSPVAKLFLLCVTKFALLDPSGMGIEMDANKPGWNDAMNGLPGLLGSGMAETAECWRIAVWLKETIARVDRGITVPAELDGLVSNITEALGDASLSDFEYWDAVADAREAYRESVRLFFSGDEVKLSAKALVSFLGDVADKLEKGIEKSLTYTDGVVMPSYFQHEVKDFEYTGMTNFVGQPFVHAKAFKAKVFPLFLEGPVRQLKTVDRDDEAQLKAIHDAVLASDLYDEPIGQYKICESLEGQPFEMGRMMAFTPGWLENESIWLHMSFKWYLELIRAKLFDEFWTAMETGAPYNMDVDTYGRSPLECGSFIVSSAYPDESMWGTSFLARLSGSTAEFLSMWLEIFVGSRPFSLSEDGELELAFAPALKGDMFKEDGTASFVFLGGVDVTYVNPAKADAWDCDVTKLVLFADADDAEGTTVHGSKLTGKDADVRDLKYGAIEVHLD
ncbi:hypothetical protein JL720_10719 [Aureococcus anophagefferens]|nr:hypothetical protein JL720_10719 [Aureococcus anophagefferens]